MAAAGLALGELEAWQDVLFNVCSQHDPLAVQFFDDHFSAAPDLSF